MCSRICNCGLYVSNTCCKLYKFYFFLSLYILIFWVICGLSFKMSVAPYSTKSNIERSHTSNINIPLFHSSILILSPIIFLGLTTFISLTVIS